MRRIRPASRVAIAAALVLALASCAKAPPTVTTPAGLAAFQNLQVQKALDEVRDIAVAANATQPPLLAESSARAIVTWHKAAITTLHARPQGWATTIQTGLAEAVKALPPKDRERLAPYVLLASTILQEVTR